ncbi:MAG: hypothetical protein AB7V22_07585 [Kiritimatiellia bacterium]
MKPSGNAGDWNVDLSDGLRERLERVAAAFQLTLAEVVHLAIVRQLPEFEAGQSPCPCPQPVPVEPDHCEAGLPPEQSCAD